MGENARFKNGHARVETRSNGRQRVKRVSKTRFEKMPLNIRKQWNAGTACVSECVLKR